MLWRRLLTIGIQGARPSGRAPLVLLCLALAGLVLACGSAGANRSGNGENGGLPSPIPSPSASAPPVMTEADSGQVYALTTADKPRLRLSNRYVWEEPRVTGPVTLAPVEYFRDPGYREWVISFDRPGQATIKSSGRPACTPGSVCPGAILAFSVTMVAS